MPLLLYFSSDDIAPDGPTSASAAVSEPASSGQGRSTVRDNILPPPTPLSPPTCVNLIKRLL